MTKKNSKPKVKSPKKPSKPSKPKSPKLPKLPIEMDGRRPELRQQPPGVGEHSRDVLREAGFDDAEIARFESDGVIV